MQMRKWLASIPDMLLTRLVRSQKHSARARSGARLPPWEKADGDKPKAPRHFDHSSAYVKLPVPPVPQPRRPLTNRQIIMLKEAQTRCCENVTLPEMLLAPQPTVPSDNSRAVLKRIERLRRRKLKLMELKAVERKLQKRLAAAH